MVNFKKLADRAKDVVDKQGGTDALKGKAERMKQAASGPGSVGDKAKAAAAAAKEQPPAEGGEPRSTGEEPPAAQ